MMNKGKQNKKRKMIILSGFSGVGKSTIAHLYANEFTPGNYSVVKTVTTRAPRKTGGFYTFTTKERFKEMLDAGQFLETNEFCGCLYGTPFDEVNRIFEDGRTPILIIDPNGKGHILEIADRYGFHPYSVFMSAQPETVYKRLIKRDGLNSNTLWRLKHSLWEAEMAIGYDAFIVNLDPERTLLEMHKAITGESKATAGWELDKYVSEMKKVVLEAGKELLINDFGREPEAEELAVALEIPVGEVRRIIRELEN